LNEKFFFPLLRRQGFDMTKGRKRKHVYEKGVKKETENGL